MPRSTRLDLFTMTEDYRRFRLTQQYGAHPEYGVVATVEQRTTGYATPGAVLLSPEQVRALRDGCNDYLARVDLATAGSPSARLIAAGQSPIRLAPDLGDDPDGDVEGYDGYFPAPRSRILDAAADEGDDGR